MATLSPQQQREAELAGTRAFIGIPALQMFNSLPPGAMAPNMPDPNAPMSYGQQMRNVGGAITDALGAAANFIFNKPGGGGVLDPNRLTFGAPAALPAAPVVSGGPDRAAGPQAMVDPASTVAKAAGPAAAAAPKKGGAAAPPPREAAAPAAPALIPGETGFYMNDQLVPYGTRFSITGDGGVTQLNNFASAPAAGGAAAPAGAAGAAAPAGAAGGSRAAQVNAAMPTAGATAIPYQQNLIDPRQYFNAMVNAQMRFAEEAASKILGAAGDGSQLGYSARLRALAAIYNNGLAQVGQGGANNFNSASASMANATTDADARKLASANALTGDLARAAATEYSADRGADAQLQTERMRDQRFNLTAQQIGQDFLPAGPGGMLTPTPRMAMPNRKTGTLDPLSPQPKEGDKGVAPGPDGKQRPVTFKNGGWVLDTGK